MTPGMIWFRTGGLRRQPDGSVHAVNADHNWALELQVPKHDFPDGVAGLGTIVSVYCAINANSGEHTWYGFATHEELMFFRRLLELEKVGPKTAFKVLDRTPWVDIETMLRDKDHAAIAKLPGLGPKAAAQLIPALFTAAPVEAAPKLNEEAVAALRALGWSAADAKAGVTAVCKDKRDATTEEIIKLCLKRK